MKYTAVFTISYGRGELDENIAAVFSFSATSDEEAGRLIRDLIVPYMVDAVNDLVVTELRLIRGEVVALPPLSND